MGDSQQDYKRIFDTMIDVYYRADVAGLCVLVTPSVFELLGYRCEELLGRPIVDVYEEPEKRAALLEEMSRQGGKLKGHEGVLRHKNGQRVWVSANLQFYYDVDGKLAGIEGHVRDISEKKKTEAILQQSEQKLRSIFDHMQDVYYRTDSDGRLVMATPSCKELLGFTPEELLGSRLSDLYVDPAVRETFLQKLQEQGGRFYGFENNLRRKDGTEIWAVASSQFYYDEQGKVAGVEGIVKDISERRKMEQRLRQAKEEAERANAAKSEFLSSINHELRTPLNAIIGFTRLLSAQPQGQFSGEVQEYIEHINHASGHLIGLIDQVLDFSQLQPGKIKLALEHFNAAEMLKKTVEILRPVAQEAGIYLQDKYCNCADATLVSDKSRLQQIVLNLVSNAIKYNKPGGEVSVSCTEKDQVYIIEVRDTGIGIPEEARERIFEPFSRLGDKKGVGGSGIGLAVARKNIELLGGQLSFESELGEGCCFWLRLPKQASGSLPPISGALSGKANQHLEAGDELAVLCVEDDPVSLRYLEMVLAGIPGVRCYKAMTAAEALAQMQQKRPDMLFLDLNLPDMKGWEFAALLKKDAATKDIAVIAMTADIAEKTQARAGMFDRYFTKPVSPDAIRSTIVGLWPGRQ